MASQFPNTITLKGDPQGREGIATVAVTPGMLLQVGARTAAAVAAQDNRILSVAPHATAGGDGTAAFAREPDIFGGSIDTVYAIGDTVLYSEFRKGDMVYAFLEDEANVAVGALLQSNGAGAFEPVAAGTPGTAFPGHALVRAMEAVNNTGGTGPVRIKVEVL